MSKNTTKIKRKKGEDTYVNISSKLLRNNDISIKARFIMCLILNDSDKWNVNLENLMEQSGIKDPKTMNKIIKELIENGYMERDFVNGIWKYTIHEMPIKVERATSQKMVDGHLPKNGWCLTINT